MKLKRQSELSESELKEDAVGLYFLEKIQELAYQGFPFIRLHKAAMCGFSIEAIATLGDSGTLGAENREFVDNQIMSKNFTESDFEKFNLTAIGNIAFFASYSFEDVKEKCYNDLNNYFTYFLG